MSHSIDHDSRDLTEWEDWARWPDVSRAATVGARSMALIMGVAAIAVSVHRVRAAASTPIRVVLATLLLEAVAIASGALLGTSLALVIRGIRRLYLVRKRRELLPNVVRSHAELP